MVTEKPTSVLVNVLTVDALLAALVDFKTKHSGDSPVRIDGCDCYGWATSTEISNRDTAYVENANAYAEVDAVFDIRRDDSLPNISNVSG